MKAEARHTVGVGVLEIPSNLMAAQHDNLSCTQLQEASIPIPPPIPILDLRSRISKLKIRKCLHPHHHYANKKRPVQYSRTNGTSSINTRLCLIHEASIPYHLI